MPPKLTTSMRNALVIARLEEQLRACQRQLLEETERHVRAAAQLQLLQALALASRVLRALLRGGARGGGGALPATPAAAGEAMGPALAALERHLSMLRLQSCSLEVDRGGFAALWRRRVSRLAVLLHQRQRRGGGMPAAHSHEINALWLGLSTGLAGLLTSGRPWAAELMVTNADTGLAAEAPPHVWDEVLEIINPTPAQGLMLLLLRRWWQDSMAALTHERRELAQAALEALEDLDVQERALEGIERLQAAYVHLGAAASAVVHTALLTPEQCAEVYVQSHPYVPTLTAILDRWHARAHAGGGAAAAGEAPSAGAPPAAGGPLGPLQAQAGPPAPAEPGGAAKPLAAEPGRPPPAPKHGWGRGPKGGRRGASGAS
ncbi:MAG: hypothetical protein J3K34DRAFT_459707 [Monoraphidium minutum]|nr:MAG: hypothetical protein J3K34DRAFT_459707 [Monoraphidium minutum]